MSKEKQVATLSIDLSKYYGYDYEELGEILVDAVNTEVKRYIKAETKKYMKNHQNTIQKAVKKIADEKLAEALKGLG